jgi:hypothetical protein
VLARRYAVAGDVTLLGAWLRGDFCLPRDRERRWLLESKFQQTLAWDL